MKVIDLLNKIANGEKVPEKIKWGKHYLTWFVYEHKALDELGNPNIFECAGGGISRNLLNDEIEIIEDTPKEDKKILEKLQTYEDDNKEIYFDDCYRYTPIHKDSLSYNEEVIVDKINEIIEVINERNI